VILLNFIIQSWTIVNCWVKHRRQSPTVHRNQNIIPTSYILEIDSSVFKSVQISSILYKKFKKKHRVAMTNMMWQREPAFSVGVITNISC
jgi:hypothetical protein